MRRAHGCPAAGALTGTRRASYIRHGARHAPESKVIMSTTRTRIGDILTLIGDAIATAAAVGEGRQPKARNLRGLGIDPKQFREIRY